MPKEEQTKGNGYRQDFEKQLEGLRVQGGAAKNWARFLEDRRDGTFSRLRPNPAVEKQKALFVEGGGRNRSRNTIEDGIVVVTMRDKSVNYRVRMDIVVLPCLEATVANFLRFLETNHESWKASFFLFPFFFFLSLLIASHPL